MADAKSRILVGTVKDEGPYLIEWICYHKRIGFDKIIIASNDSSDRTKEMLDLLDREGEIIHLENSDQPVGLPKDPQNRAYQRIWNREDVKNSEWVLVLDADEFLNIHVGDGSLDALFMAISDASSGKADLVSASWKVFGNGGITAFKDEFVIDQFTKSANEGVHRIQRYTAFKTLFRPRFVKALGIHRPRLAPRFRNKQRPVVWVNGSGQQMPDRYLTQGWRFFEENYGAALVSINHYMIKSSEAFLMKRYRGTANSDDQDRIDFSYFDTFNVNDVTETRIQRHSKDLHEARNVLISRLPALEALHNESISFHLQKLAKAKSDLKESAPAIATKLGL